MMIGFGSRFLGLLVCTTIALSACDDDGGGKTGDDTGDTDGGMDAGGDEEDDASAEDASAPSDSGSDARRDSAPPMDAENPYTCEPPPLPDGDIGVGEGCCEGLGTCTEISGDAGSSAGYGDCKAAENLRCVPRAPSGDAGAGDGGAGAPVTCRMKPAGTPDGGTDYEGRCIPECLTRGVSSSLTQGECAAEFICVPCYSLITGASTGACNSGGDAPVEAAPMGFDECGDTAGYCVPNTSIGDAGTTLMQLTCDEDERCVPKSRVVSPNSCFAHCDSIFGAGACLPTFLVPESNRGTLQPATCATGELCVPCINPLTTMATGACR
jgi:hypothetical protein